MINLKHLSAILTIIQEGSITAASKKLFVSQPALSQLVKTVEGELGAPLFERDNNRLILTHAGKLYLNAAQAIQAIDNNLHLQVAESKNDICGELHMGISNQRGLQLLPYVIPRFAGMYPFISIKLIEKGSDVLERMVREGQCDIAFVTTTKKNNHLHYILIESEKIVLIANKNTEIAHRFEDGATIDIAEARDEVFISMNNDHSIRVIQNRLFESHGLNPHILLETTNMEAAKAIVAHSNTVFLLPKVYISGESPLRSSISVFNIQNSEYERHFYFCHNRDIYLARYQKDFVNLVCDCLHVPRVYIPTI